MFRRIFTSGSLVVAPVATTTSFGSLSAFRSYSVTAKEIQALRWKTEAPMVDCKKALVASDGDMAAAVTWLQKHGAAKAVKKGDRVTDNGTVLAALSEQGKGAVIVQVCSETDFASRNDRYLEFTKIVRQKTIEHLETQKHGLTDEYGLTTDEHAARVAAMLAAVQSSTEEARTQAVAILGENITVKQLYAMPNLTPDQAKSVISVPMGAGSPSEPIIPYKNFYGFYCHNTPNAEHRYVGSIAAIVQVQPRNEDGKGIQTGDSYKGIQVSEIAQHCVANVFNDGPITQQRVLGTDETAGQWMKRHGVKLQRALIVQNGKPPVIHTIEAPYEGGKDGGGAPKKE